MNSLENLLTKLEGHADEPCVSVIVPLEKSYPANQQNHLRFKNAIKEVQSKLETRYSQETADALVQEITAMEKQLDYINTQEAIAVYVSPTLKETVELPIPVVTTVEVDDFFILSPLRESMASQKKYLVLALSKGNTRLFNGENNRLTEIKNDLFPMPFENEYQDEKTDPRFKKEESTVNNSRVTGFFRDVNRNLQQYMNNRSIPVVLMGVEKHLSTYEKISHHHPTIVEKINGNYDKQSESQIAEVVWPKIQTID